MFFKDQPFYHNPCFQLQNAHSALVALTKEKDRVIELKVLQTFIRRLFVFEQVFLVPLSNSPAGLSGARNC